jgi:hypothetical protein
MLVTRTSMLSKETRTMDIDVTPQQLDRIENSFFTKELIQNIVPHLSPSDREFLKTGIIDAEWDLVFEE